MTEKTHGGEKLIVACCRMPAPGVVVHGPHGYLHRVGALTRRAEALGARLVAWGSTTVAFAWDLDSVAEAILLVLGLRDDSAPPEAQWACGMAEGELERLGRSDLAWGEPMLRAFSLSRIRARCCSTCMCLRCETASLRRPAFARRSISIARRAA